MKDEFLASMSYELRAPLNAVLALSEAMPGDRERCLAAGANEYLTKPISLRTLREVIDRFLGRSRDQT